MELKDFITKFAALFEDTDAAEFAPETNFRELEEWSSIMGLSVIAMINEEYDVSINGSEMRSANTIQDLFDIVKTK